MQWMHSRLHSVPVIWIQSDASRTNGAWGTVEAPGVRTGSGILVAMATPSMPEPRRRCHKPVNCPRVAKSRIGDRVHSRSSSFAPGLATGMVANRTDPLVNGGGCVDGSAVACLNATEDSE